MAKKNPGIVPGVQCPYCKNQQWIVRADKELLTTAETMAYVDHHGGWNFAVWWCPYCAGQWHHTPS